MRTSRDHHHHAGSEGHGGGGSEDERRSPCLVARVIDSHIMIPFFTLYYYYPESHQPWPFGRKVCSSRWV